MFGAGAAGCYNPPGPLETALRSVEQIHELIGKTPMLRLRALELQGGASIHAKLEVFNPGGSIKDRAAHAMILQAEKDGRLQPGGTIIEPTAGNTGIALAMLAVPRGYRVILCVPDCFQGEKIQLMRALGGEIVRTPGDRRMAGAIDAAIEMSRRIPGSFIPQQFENEANPKTHYRTTGPEIWEQMEGRIDAAVLGAGSGGTFTGVCRYLKERCPELPCYLVESEGSVLGGGEAAPHELEGIGASFVPQTLDLDLAEEVITVADEPAFEMVRRLARTVGLLAGGSGGAVVTAAVQVAGRMDPAQRVMTLIPDSCERYLSKIDFEMVESAAR